MNLHKYFLPLVLSILSLNVCYSQNYRVIENELEIKYPDNFKNYLSSPIVSGKTIRFIFHSEKYELIKLDDVGVLIRQNSIDELDFLLKYTETKIRSTFDIQDTLKLVPIATSLNHNREDKVDFLGIAISPDEKINNKIIYINIESDLIHAAIVAKNFHVLLGESNNYHIAKDLNNRDTLDLGRKANLNSELFDVFIPQIALFYDSINISHNTGCQIDIVKARINSTNCYPCGYKKIDISLIANYSNSLYRKEFRIIDSTRPSSLKYHKFDVVDSEDYPRVYSCAIKCLNIFISEISLKEPGISSILIHDNLDNILREALWEQVSQAYDKSLEIEQPFANIQIQENLRQYLCFRKDTFNVSFSKDKSLIEDTYEDISYQNIINTFSKKQFNTISDSMQIMPFAMNRRKDGKYQFLSIINYPNNPLDSKIFFIKDYWIAFGPNDKFEIEVIEQNYFSFLKENQVHSLDFISQTYDNDSQFTISNTRQKGYRSYIPYLSGELSITEDYVEIIFDYQKKFKRYEVEYRASIETESVYTESELILLISNAIDNLAKNSSVAFELLETIDRKALSKRILYNYCD